MLTQVVHTVKGFSALDSVFTIDDISHSSGRRQAVFPQCSRSDHLRNRLLSVGAGRQSSLHFLTVFAYIQEDGKNDHKTADDHIQNKYQTPTKNILYNF